MLIFLDWKRGVGAAIRSDTVEVHSIVIFIVTHLSLLLLNDDTAGQDKEKGGQVPEHRLKHDRGCVIGTADTMARNVRVLYRYSSRLAHPLHKAVFEHLRLRASCVAVRLRFYRL
jgi:hypothetical protein